MAFTGKDRGKSIDNKKKANSKSNKELKAITERDMYEINYLKLKNDSLENNADRLGESENHYEKIYKYAPIAYVTLNKEGFILEKNLKASQLFDFNSEGVKNLNFFIHSDDQKIFASHLKSVFSGEYHQICDIKLNTKDNKDFFARLSSMPFEGNEESCLTAIIDVDELMKKEKIVSKMAYYDTLTGLPNRAMFLEKLTHKIKMAKDTGSRLVVMFIDLDNFKKINDTLGHDAGDLLLKVIGKRMKSCIRGSDILSRMAGDEFTILMQDLSELKKVADAAERLLHTISQPFTVCNTTHTLSASIGIAVYPEDGLTADEIIKNADRAMYKSKINGKCMYYFYDDSMKEEISKKVKIEHHLRHALDKKELSICYQPQIETVSGEIRGIEALMRWNSKKLGTVSPDEFLPLAEESSLMISYGDWVLKNACMNNKKWQKEGLPEVVVTVNISSVQFNREGFVKTVKDILRATKLDPKYLELEITEDILNEDRQTALNKLNELKELGVGICLDDFGKIHSSINCLKTLPLKAIKLDSIYINSISKEKNSRNLIKNIISLAHGLGLKVSAEGVETVEQMEILKKSRCDYMQGFYLYRPMDEKTIKSLIKQPPK